MDEEDEISFAKLTPTDYNTCDYRELLFAAAAAVVTIVRKCSINLSSGVRRARTHFSLVGKTCSPEELRQERRLIHYEPECRLPI